MARKSSANLISTPSIVSQKWGESARSRASGKVVHESFMH